MLQIIGRGGFAREVACYTHATVSHFEHEEIDYASDIPPTIIAIGDPAVRRKIAYKYPELSYIVMNNATVYGTAKIGDGSILCPGTILTTNITIGNFTIVNLNCTIGHDTIIGDFVTISPGVNISGNVSIGDNCYIGTNAVIREKIVIGNDIIVGAGAVVVKDLLEPGVYVGNPVRLIKK